MATVSEDQIRLVSVEQDKFGNVPLRGQVVKLAVYDKNYDSLSTRRELMTIALRYSDDKYKDEDLVRIAKADFHDLCKELAELTAPWALSMDQRMECERTSEEDEISF